MPHTLVYISKSYQLGSLALGKLTNIKGTSASNASSADKFKYLVKLSSESFPGNAQILWAFKFNSSFEALKPKNTFIAATPGLSCLQISVK